MLGHGGTSAGHWGPHPHLQCNPVPAGMHLGVRPVPHCWKGLDDAQALRDAPARTNPLCCPTSLPSAPWSHPAPHWSIPTAAEPRRCHGGRARFTTVGPNAEFGLLPAWGGRRGGRLCTRAVSVLPSGCNRKPNTVALRTKCCALPSCCSEYKTSRGATTCL